MKKDYTGRAAVVLVALFLLGLFSYSIYDSFQEAKYKAYMQGRKDAFNQVRNALDPIIDLKLKEKNWYETGLALELLGVCLLIDTFKLEDVLKS